MSLRIKNFAGYFIVAMVLNGLAWPVAQARAADPFAKAAITEPELVTGFEERKGPRLLLCIRRCDRQNAVEGV